MDPLSAQRELLRLQIGELWGRGRVELGGRLYDDSVVDHMPLPGQAAGRAPLLEVVHEFHRAFPDLQIEVHGVLAERDLAVDFWTFTGTHRGPLFGRPATHRKVRFDGIDMVRVANGRIRDIWHVEDLLLMEAQLDGGAPAIGHPARPADGAAAESAFPRIDTDAAMHDVHARTATIARRHIEGIWAAGDARLAYELYAPDVVDHNPAPRQRPGIAGIVDVLEWLHEAVPDLSMRIHEYVVDGEYACDRWTLTGTHTGRALLGFEPRGAKLEFAGMDVIRVRDDGRISDVWHVEEFWRMRRQLDAAERGA